MAETIKKNINMAYDMPTSRDYVFELPDEYAAGEYSPRPSDLVNVQNQKATLGCTMFATQNIVNGNNILEDKKNELGIIRAQIDSHPFWKKFCEERGYEAGDSIQHQALMAKSAGLISGFASIFNGGGIERVIEEMKKALSIGGFMLSGSCNGDWSATGKTKIYTLRTDGKYVGHAFAIVDYIPGYFIAMNSWGDKWGDKGYFLVPEDLVTKLYTKLVFSDADDTIWFMRIKELEIAKETVRQMKKTYHLGLVSEDTRQMCSKIASELRNKYGFTDNDL